MGKIYEALERAEEPGAANTVARQEIGGVDLFEQQPELVVLGRPGANIAEKFRFLRSLIVRPPDGTVRRTLLITSALQGEGKSFIASNLAVTLAQGLDEYVLLVDADLRYPRMHSIFGYPVEAPGLADHLIDGLDLSDVLKRPVTLNSGHGEKFSVLPAGRSTPNPHELLSSQRMRRFINEVRDRYPDRYIIFDSPPLELAPESLVMAHELEGTYLVVRKARTPREIIKSAQERIPKKHFLGVVFNGHEVSKKYYAFRNKNNDSYGYGYGYGYGSHEGSDNEHPAK